jgi:hypothetical protein
MVMQLKTKLSDKPSELLRQALADLYAVEKRPECVINMDTYVAMDDGPEGSRVCELCMAGAVMYLGTPEIQALFDQDGFDSAGPMHFGNDSSTAKKLYFISEFQFGHYSMAFSFLDLPRPDFLPADDEHFVAYADNPLKYKRKIRGLANKLERHGL